MAAKVRSAHDLLEMKRYFLSKETGDEMELIALKLLAEVQDALKEEPEPEKTPPLALA